MNVIVVPASLRDARDRRTRENRYAIHHRCHRLIRHRRRRQHLERHAIAKRVDESPALEPAAADFGEIRAYDHEDAWLSIAGGIMRFHEKWRSPKPKTIALNFSASHREHVREVVRIQTGISKVLELLVLVIADTNPRGIQHSAASSFRRAGESVAEARPV